MTPNCAFWYYYNLADVRLPKKLVVLDLHSTDTFVKYRPDFFRKSNFNEISHNYIKVIIDMYLILTKFTLKK